MTDEINRITEQYRQRDLKKTAGSQTSCYALYESYKKQERESIYRKLLGNNFTKPFSTSRILEIGAGYGINLPFFMELGIRNENIWANELLPWRIDELKKHYYGIHILPGSALELEGVGPFDIVLQSLVFTSILESTFKRELACKMLKWLSPGGLILWYDFKFNNPRNPNVKGINRRGIRDLFPDTEIIFRIVTLAPPIGRMAWKMYPLVNQAFPFLRTHLVACIRKKE